MNVLQGILILFIAVVSLTACAGLALPTDKFKRSRHSDRRRARLERRLLQRLLRNLVSPPQRLPAEADLAPPYGLWDDGDWPASASPAASRQRKDIREMQGYDVTLDISRQMPRIGQDVPVDENPASEPRFIVDVDDEIARSRETTLSVDEDDGSDARRGEFPFASIFSNALPPRRSTPPPPSHIYSDDLSNGGFVDPMGADRHGYRGKGTAHHKEEKESGRTRWRNRGDRKTAGGRRRVIKGHPLSSYQKLKLIDSPIIECEKAEDGLEMLACPTPDKFGRYICIEDHALCDRKLHCPGGEDENPTSCMFHKTTMNYFSVLMNSILRLSKTVI